MSSPLAATDAAQASAASSPSHERGFFLKIGVVVSVCAKRDADVWAVAAPQIARFISASRYIVIVPDGDVAVFRACTPSVFDVVAESIYVAEFLAQLGTIQQLAGQRTGWYLQQFIKLAFLRSAAPDELVLIWDADTIPLRPLHFLNADGTLNFYRGEEFHAPYFSAIAKLAGQTRLTDRSFIAQCFPIYGRWAAEFFGHIEVRHATGWANALLDCIDFAEPSGFSEYETLGTFLTHTHPNEMRLASGSWDRRGRAYTGEAQMLHWRCFHRPLRRLDFVAYEKWDKPFEVFPGLLRRLLRSLLIAKGRR